MEQELVKKDVDEEIRKEIHELILLVESIQKKLNNNKEETKV